MVTIPEEYYTKEKEIKLTQSEINLIIDELERTEHNIYIFLNYKKIIKKLREEQNEKEKRRIKRCKNSY